MARRPFRSDDLWLLRGVTDVRWSPDGELVAFNVTRHDQGTNTSETSVWVTTPEGAARPFARPTSHSARFSPDGAHIAFIADRGDGLQLHLADLNGGEPHAVTDHPHGVSLPAWSPDGSRVAYVARTGAAHDPEMPRVVRGLRQRLDGFGWLDDRRSHIFVYDLGTGLSAQVTDGDWDDDQPSWTPDGKDLVFISDRSEKRFDRPFHRDLWTTSAKGGSPRRLTRGRGDAMEAHVAPDGKTVAYVGGEHGDAMWSAATELLTVPFAGSDHAPRSLTVKHDVHAGTRFLAAGRQLAWVDGGRALMFVGPRRGGFAVFRTTKTGTKIDVVAGGDRSHLGFDVAADGQLAFPGVWISEPPEVYVAQAGGPAEPATDLHQELKATVRLSRGRRVTSRSADGTVTESFLVKPAVATGPTRLTLDIHGGPHGQHPGTSTGGWAAVQALAGAGHHVLMPNPRGSAGYGAEFLGACVGDWGGGDADDILAAVDHAEATVRPKRTYVWGYSFGGFMTTWLIGHTDQFAAAVIGAPVIDLTSMLGTTDIPGFTAHEVGGLPWESPDEYAKHSPLTYAPNIDTPVLLLHHEGDLRCPVGQSEELFSALLLLGKDVELVRYPGGFHGVAKPALIVDRTQRLIAWFAAR